VTQNSTGWNAGERHPARVELHGIPFSVLLTLRSRLGVLALHGGLEGGTAELATAIADICGASLLSFRQPFATARHLASHRMADPGFAHLTTFLQHVELVVSVHGHLRPSEYDQIYLGGSHRTAAEVLARHLAAEAPAFVPVTDISRIPPSLRGLRPDNPVNMAARGGVQVELPLPARDAFPQTGPREYIEPPATVVSALSRAILELARRPNLNPSGTPQ
jgi:phage replication-related protein YjqB (UPF0714/DUF867 family)